MSHEPPEPPPEVWDTLPVADYEDPREVIGYRSPERSEPPPAPLKQALEAVAARVEPELARSSGHTCAVCNRSHPLRSFGECVFCQGDRNRRTGNALRDVIRELKEGRANGERERHLVKQLHELGHPDVKGLLDRLEAQRSTGGRARGGL